MEAPDVVAGEDVEEAGDWVPHCRHAHVVFQPAKPLFELPPAWLLALAKGMVTFQRLQRRIEGRRPLGAASPAAPAPFPLQRTVGSEFVPPIGLYHQIRVPWVARLF